VETRFFYDVMGDVEDAGLRTNRLALLAQLRSLMNRIARPVAGLSSADGQNPPGARTTALRSAAYLLFLVVTVIPYAKSRC